jgi:hypothetical protein
MTTRAEAAAKFIADNLLTGMRQGSPELAAGLDDMPELRDAITRLMVEDVRRIIVAHVGECAGNADEHEPIFTVRARDTSAVAAIQMWITIARRNGTPEAKLLGAADVVRKFVDWQSVNETKVAD